MTYVESERKMYAKKSALVLLLACAALLGCAPQSQNQDVATGLLEISLTDAPPDLNVEKALVTISSVQVHLAGEEEAPDEETEAGWFTAVEAAQTFDLIALRDPGVCRTRARQIHTDTPQRRRSRGDNRRGGT
jgi:hypothetical protein